MPLTNQQRIDNLKNLIIKLQGATQTTRYLALSSTAPQADGTGVTEPSGNGYQRIPMQNNIIASLGQNFNLNSPTYDSQNDKYSYTNIVDIYFYEATGSWGTLGYFAIYDAQTSGNFIAFGSLANTISPVINSVPVIRTGDLTIEEQ